MNTKVQMSGITIYKSWSSDHIVKMCIDEGFYSCGTNTDYDSMLSFVDDHKPTYENIYKVAYDITMNTDSKLMNDNSAADIREFIQNVMFIICRNVVIDCFVPAAEVEYFEKNHTGCKNIQKIREF